MSAHLKALQSSPQKSRIRLSQMDAGWRAAVPEDQWVFADRFVSGIRYDLPPGTWLPDRLGLDERRDLVAVLLLEGVLVQEVLLAGRVNAELLGPGDVFRPWRSLESALPAPMRWSVLGRGAVIAALDGPFAAAARKWPDLQRVLTERFADQLDASARRAAIIGLPRVEQRVLALFWHLAERFGVVGRDGVIIRLELTHDLIGRLTGAKRPTVSLALAVLAETGDLLRVGAAEWRLRGGSSQALECEWRPPALVPVAG